MRQSAQKGIAIAGMLLIVAGVVIVILLKDKVNLKTATSQPSPNPSQIKLPIPNPIPTLIPLPTEKNLVSLSNSFGSSITYGTAYGPYKAFDGDTSTRWSAAKDQFYGQIWLEWSTTKTVTSFSWSGLDSKYGALKILRSDAVTLCRLLAPQPLTPNWLAIIHPVPGV